MKPLKPLLKKTGLAFAVTTLLCAIGAGLSWIGFNAWLNSPMALSAQGYTYELKPGQSLGHLANQMAADGVLEYPRLLRLYGRMCNASKIHAGEYFFQAGTTPKTLVEKLMSGEVILYQVTFVEGWTYQQLLDALHGLSNIQHSLEGKTEEQQKALLEINEPHLEGWFFPDTYTYTRNTRDIEILKQAHSRMRSLLMREWEQKADGLPYKTPYEALIMASIIERETGSHSERNQIAGVFVRRLQKGMKLQTDPTVIYGMGANYAGKISRKHLQVANQYNTYVINGLPPTPISMPSEASIKAALHPSSGDALYFVARGDGTSEFSATLKDHNAAVRRYQLKRRADYRSTPPTLIEENSDKVPGFTK